jgi:hypothetical protein
MASLAAKEISGELDCVELKTLTDEKCHGHSENTDSGQEGVICDAKTKMVHI